MLILTQTGHAIFSFYVVLVAQVEESGDGHVHFKQNISASSAIASVRAAKRHKLLAQKGETTTSTIASLGVYFDLIDKFHNDDSG
jgi:hypothetical protein